ncbi:MAG: 2OG-Fe dioxygenase family protein [Nevskia sp.]|nr:2OG-Fe dioxygenase family protein [Nevskia sp.]
MDRSNQALQTDIVDAIRRDGYLFVPAGDMRWLLEWFGELGDWHAFAESWDDLRLDPHMADGGRYRHRRHAVYTVTSGGHIAREPHQPHYQDVAYNPLNGGIYRWFEPVSPGVGEGATLRTVLTLCAAVFGHLAPVVNAWKAEVHQFRIEMQPGEVGHPTPEGPHRDGVDYVLVLLIARHNIQQGTTEVYGLEREKLGSFTLTETFDAAFVDDPRVYHGVTPVRPLQPRLPAHRDVLVVTFKAK